MDNLIDFYLLQLPPIFRATRENIARLSDYVRSVNLVQRLAVEFRHESWFNETTVNLFKDLGVTLVSIDSPVATWINSSGDTIYLRMHGRNTWYLYNYNYNIKELRHLALTVIKRAQNRIYVFFNNNHYMLENARFMKKILEGLDGLINTHDSVKPEAGLSEYEHSINSNSSKYWLTLTDHLRFLPFELQLLIWDGYGIL